MRSRPAKAETSMNSVERGRWKLVSSRSTARKLEARRDEDVGLAGPWLASRRHAVARHRFEQPQRRRADRDDAAAAGACRLDGARGGLGTSPHSACMVWASVSSTRTGWNGAGADMQRDARRGDAGVGKRGHQVGREVQARGGAATGAVVSGEQGLVIGAVLRVGGAAADVGGRGTAPPCSRAARNAWPACVEGQHERAVLGLGFDRGAEARRRPAVAAAAAAWRARRRSASGAAPRSRISNASTATSWRPPCRGRTPFEPRRDDLGVVEDQQVAAAQQRRAGRAPCGRAAPSARDIEQARGVARRDRPLGDQARPAGRSRKGRRASGGGKRKRRGEKRKRRRGRRPSIRSGRRP